MQSLNFEFLRPTQPDLAALGALAEAYARRDPASALVKLRSLAECFVARLYQTAGWPAPAESSLYDLLNETVLRDNVPRVVLNKLHALRVNGNKAAHGDPCTATTALWVLREAFDVAAWFFVAIGQGDAGAVPQFTEPPALPARPATPATDSAAKQERREILARLAAQEAQIQQLLAEVAQSRQPMPAPAPDVAELAQRGANAAQALHFNEAATRRRLIDSALTDAGWEVGAGGRDTEQVKQEVKLDGQPTATGVGYADYVLYGDDGQPLAVIEAKRTAKDAEAGRKQAELYANALEAKHGRRPVIFYTNGYEIYLWHDKLGETPRRLFGFYSQESLEYLMFQRTERKPLHGLEISAHITDRLYQIEAIKRVAERFSQGHRRALIVQATGTGKTRVAISLCELLTRARWAKRILFLCDRRELRKQAEHTFKEFLPGEPRTIVTAETANDRDKRIYLATYPAMLKCFQTFDVGFFDLIIADESHRSIYHRYRDLFQYFDSLQVGLTATPVRFVQRNTYQLFGCEDKDPTAFFSFEEAINHTPPYLVPFEVYQTTTEFMRRGIKYRQMSAEQREQLEEQAGDAEFFDYEAAAIDRAIFNKDTNRAIVRNLMEHGLRDATNSHPGKSIIFARNHNHALLLQQLFDEMYPQYGGQFCRVIDNYDPRAEQLIDDFKGTGTNPKLTIAISVDMLDTGIDIPEVVNLVFAKPVKSYVKFWQMIGRGTRLRPNLFGWGRHKECFRIFDHWGNFEFFEEHYREAAPAPTKSLLHQLFEARLRLAETALAQGDAAAFDATIELIGADVADLPESSIAVREKRREVDTVRGVGVLTSYTAAVRGLLWSTIGPLMQWRNVAGYEAAYSFDLLLARLQTEHVQGSASFENLKQELLNLVAKLPVNLNPVRQQWALITALRGADFWAQPTPARFEEVRRKLRGLMGLIEPLGGIVLPPKVIDVAEDRALIERVRHIPKLEGLELAAYRQRVEQVLRDLLAENAALQKIQAGQPVTAQELEELCALVLAHDPQVNLRDLGVHYPELADQLDLAIRSIIGLQPEAVADRFQAFVQQHPALSAKQLRFLSLLQNHIARYGGIELARLYEPPFTTLDSNGIDGVFTDERQIDELLDIIASFS